MAEPSPEIVVLHVDDDPNFGSLLREALEATDDRFRIETAANGAAALDRLGDGQFDCVVSDYKLPGMDGLELLAAVRESEPDLPFLLFTGEGSEVIASEAIRAGVTDYLKKRPGENRFSLLANRIRNAVEQVRAERQAAAARRINVVVRKVNEALVRAETRAEIDEQVCSILSAADPYRFAWIGDLDETTDTIEPRSTAGTESAYLSSIDIAAEGGDLAQGPTARALREDELTVVQDISEDPDYEPWRETALEQGFRSSAAIPLTYEDTQYGVLNVYADRPNAFDTREVTLLSDLGESIAHAYHRVSMQERNATQIDQLERLTDLFDQAQSIADLGAWETDVLAETGWWTEQVSRIYGLPLDYEPDPGEGIEYFHPEDRETIREAYERAIDQGEPYDLELRVVDEQGEHKWVRARGEPQLEDGTVTRVRGTLQDITDTKAREEDLKRTNAVLSKLVETLPQGILVEDESRSVLVTNQRLFSLLDMPGSPTEVEGADCEALIEEVKGQFDTPETFADRITELVGNRTPVDHEELTLADGRTLERSYRPLELPEGRGHLWVYREITDRRERQRELETVLERMNDAVFVHATDGPFLFVNQAACERYGYTEADLAEMTPADLDVPAEAEHVEERIETVTTQGEYVFETEHRTATGETFPVEVSASRITFRGEPAVLSIVRDVTERKAQADRLRRQNARLEEFASVVSHDLRNPLNVAQGRIELARETGSTDHLTAAKDGVDRSLELIEDMLALARAGEGASEAEPVALSEFAATCWTQVDTDPAALTVEATGTILADRSRFRQLLENLFRNAVEHGGEAVTVTVGDLEDGFYVADDGAGIPEAEQNAVFETGHTESASGNGLGLSIVTQIADAHGWELAVTESEAGGARFEFRGVSRPD
ncbi:PAS domain S-box protein [Halodesulfurarchaeum formicicum]|uniref:histidine kinase n=1 Tax=Halodesulfurarchaeum formicicum TaxID=1873524 RepID=A0A1J1ADT3_9EURY|nr:PAS domain S-box protein [Halodesulfurarchaeum formicicum]APE96302.1 multi-sensor signal transduction histidine kinase [Halodesulfurarchaeum formicicum]